ncbi:mitochondrial import inner membrane translocase subunit Tim21 isoform X2 [Salmo salar]|uniref:Mitochondrial import inner membrane translocase subunit Tim21 n=1 Tax=Salmo salar TaxID=8030 RepID=A0A1S3QBI7_SALSA|nr:mitochondrial import inner membrane translocase subunit Tim21-like isoform X2 [Salmo salar]|eukprot:XP_014037217.1 PREDICTED: mitochondrial import inner membrane translocase subunit Tim21-like isoform X2 [Salmo salar]
MVYSFILKAVQRNLQQHQSLSTQCVDRIWKRMQNSVHLQNPTTALSRYIFYRTADRSPIASGIFCTQNRSISLDTRLKSKEEKDGGQVSVPRRGPSTAHKGGLLYVVFQELLSSSSPSKVYSKAFNKTRLHPEVIGVFGEPIKCFGETSRRGRRQQVSHVEYMKDGLKHMRLKFYIEGDEPGRQGTVHTESKENPETGKLEFRYIFVEVDTYPRRTIVIEDNR